MKWPDRLDRAKEIQAGLAEKVRVSPFRGTPRVLAGVDAAFSETHVFAAAVLCSFPGLEPLEEEAAVAEIRFPYVPGYLSFREAPAVIEAVRRLRTIPDVILVDGQGIAHPRRIGIASHIGVLLDIPTIGCAKSRLIGEAVEPKGRKGSWTPLVHEGAVIGAVVRTKNGVRPVFVSPGHRVDLGTCLEIVMACATEYRIPEPLRRADRLSKEAKRAAKTSMTRASGTRLRSRTRPRSFDPRPEPD